MIYDCLIDTFERAALSDVKSKDEIWFDPSRRCCLELLPCVFSISSDRIKYLLYSSCYMAKQQEQRLHSCNHNSGACTYIEYTTMSLTRPRRRGGSIAQPSVRVVGCPSLVGRETTAYIHREFCRACVPRLCLRSRALASLISQMIHLPEIDFNPQFWSPFNANDGHLFVEHGGVKCGRRKEETDATRPTRVRSWLESDCSHRRVCL